MRTISILIADNQFLIRSGLRHLLNSIPTFKIISEVKNSEDLLIQLEAKKIDVIIVDHRNLTGFDENILKQIKQNNPKTNILVISADEKKKRILSLLENGINSFLTKECDEEEIINAVNATSKNEKFFCNKVLDFLIENTFSDEKKSKSPQLSPREKEIVNLVVSGKVAQAIADELNLSKHTVYTHRKNIMKKLKLNSASELFLYAINEGLIEQ